MKPNSQNTNIIRKSVRNKNEFYIFPLDCKVFWGQNEPLFGALSFSRLPRHFDPGATHDALVFQFSPLFAQVQRLFHGSFILARIGYFPSDGKMRHRDCPCHSRKTHRELIIVRPFLRRWIPAEDERLPGPIRSLRPNGLLPTSHPRRTETSSQTQPLQQLVKFPNTKAAIRDVQQIDLEQAALVEG